MTEKITINEIIDIVCEIAGVERWQMLSERRRKRDVRARQCAMWLAYRSTGHSYPTIGRAFNRDHTTVMHAVRVFESRTTRDNREALLADVQERAGLEFPDTLHRLIGGPPVRFPLIVSDLFDADERADRQAAKHSERRLLAALMREHPDKYQPLEGR